MSKICPYCGNQINDTDAVCPVCGQNVQQVYAQPGQNQAGFGQPQAGFGQPQAGFGQPQAGFGQPQAGFGQPGQQQGVPGQQQGIAGFQQPGYQQQAGFQQQTGYQQQSSPYSQYGNNPQFQPQQPNGQPGFNAGGGFQKIDLKNNKLFKIIIAAIAAIVVLVIAVNIIRANTGYKPVIKKMVKAYQDFDLTGLESITSDVAYSIIDDNYSREPQEVYKDRVEDALDDMEEDVGGTIKSIKIEYTDEQVISDRKLESIKMNLVKNYNYDTDAIKKIVKVSFKLTVKGPKKTKSYPVSVYMIKENGKWKVCSTNEFYYISD